MRLYSEVGIAVVRALLPDWVCDDHDEVILDGRQAKGLQLDKGRIARPHHGVVGGQLLSLLLSLG